MNIAVVGGGLAGLVAGAEASALGHDVVLFEASGRLGGAIETIREGGYLFEAAVSSVLLPDPAVTPVFDRIGVEMVPATGAARRYLATADGFVDLPATPVGMLSFPLLGAGAKLRALADMLITSPGPDDESVAAYCTRRFGRDAGRLAAHLVATGVFAGDPNRLELRSAFERLAAIEGSVIRHALQRSGPRRSMQVPLHGMADVVDHLARQVPVMKMASPVVGLEQTNRGWRVILEHADLAFDAVIVAVPPRTAADLLPHVGVPIPDHADVAVVGLGGDHVPQVQGFGALRSPDAKWLSAGLLFESSYAPNRAPAGASLIRVIAGGTARRDIAEMDDKSVLETVVDEAGRIAAQPCEPSWIRVIRRRIPQYPPGFAARRADMHSAIRSLSPLAVVGWGVSGIGVASVVASARRAAREVTNA